MRRVILTLGLVVGIAAWAIGLYGLGTTVDAHTIPVPNRLTSFGVSAMLGTLLIFVVVFAHSTRAGDVD